MLQYVQILVTLSLPQKYEVIRSITRSSYSIKKTYITILCLFLKYHDNCTHIKISPQAGGRKQGKSGESCETECRNTDPCGGYGYSLRLGTVSHATKLGTETADRATVPCMDKCLRAEWPLPTKALPKLYKTLEPPQKLSSVFHTTEFEG